MTVDFIYLFRQIEFTHQCGHALVLSFFAGLLDAQEELETRGGGERGGGSLSQSIPTCSVGLAVCEAGGAVSNPWVNPSFPSRALKGLYRIVLMFPSLFPTVAIWTRINENN